LLLREAALLRALDELRAPGVDDVSLLLADRLDTRVRARQLDTAEVVQNAHDGLLVDHHAVRLAENLLDHRVRVLRRLAAVLALDVLVHHAAFERPRAVQRRTRDDVADVVRLHPLEQLADALTLELEHTLRVAALQELIHARVVERKLVYVDVGTASP